MPRIITSHEKLSVIEHWLSGELRNDIAIRHNIGSGTVYNIVEEWSNEVGPQLADRLRELAIQLKKNGSTVIDCAKGLRMLVILKKYGIKDDENQERVPYFLKEIYTKSQEVGLTPQQVFDYIGDILKFSNEIPISQIPEFMKKRLDEKEKIESEVQELSKKRDELIEIKEGLEQEIQELRNSKEIRTKTYRIFIIAKSKLKQYGIEMDDIDKFAKCVVGVSKENYNPLQIVTKIADYEKLEQDANYYKTEVNLQKDELAKVNRDIELQKITLNYFKIKVDLIEELEARGFGNNELRSLIYILNEIGLEYNQDFVETRKKFFDDIKNYEEVIGSRKEIDRLKNERKSLEVETRKEREKCNSYPKVIESIMRLLGAGIYEDDIVKIDKILSMTDYYLFKDEPLYKETLINDLQKYGNLKLAIKNLEGIKTDLKSIKNTQGKPKRKKQSNVSKTSKLKETIN